MSERTEALMRIVVGVISGIILSLWKVVVHILIIVQWIIALLTGTRNQDIAEFCEIWNTQVYIFLRYMAFVSNKRPFPFSALENNISKFE